nr:hypothetical protein [uncultured Roseibium sp.]
MLKHSTSLATLFGRSACPLFLATALVVAPGVANAQNVTIDNTDNLNETNGDWPGGTNELTADGGTLTVEEGVTMTIDEDGAGLFVDGVADVVITNNGTIITWGTALNTGPSDSAARSFGYADGMYIVNADNALVINNGLIDVDDPGVDNNTSASAMFVRGEGAQLINNNQINIRGDYGYGMVFGRGNDGFLLNNGTISMINAHRTRGMIAYGWNPAVVVGLPADNRFETLTGHLLVNRGVIEATKESTDTDIHGMRIDGTDEEDVSALQDKSELDQYIYIVDAAMHNYGTIRVSLDNAPGTSGDRDDASGMRTEAHNVDMYNYGTINLESTGIGMDADGSGLGVYNYGTIIVDGGNAATPTLGVALYAVGMQVFSDRAILNYDDDAATDDYRTDGTEQDYRNKTVNAGLIQVNISNNAPDAMGAGVHIAGDSGQDFYNYGSIIVQNGWSIVLDADEFQGQGILRVNNLYLFDGSILVGDINVNPAANDEWHLTFGDGYNAAVRFDTASGTRASGFEEFYLNRYNYANGYKGHFPDVFIAPNGYALIDNVAYTFDLESYSQQDQATWSMVSMIQDAVDSSTENRPPSGDFGFNGDDGAGMSNKWAQMFAGWVRDPGDGEVGVGSEATDEHEGGFNGYSAGTIIGVNMPERSYFLGAAYSKVDSIDWMDNDTGFDTQSGTLFGGIATTIRDRFDLSLTAGVSYNHSERDTADNRVSTGIHTMSSDYASVFLSPSLLIDGPIGSSLRLNYLGGWTQSHSYTLSGGEKLEVEQRLNHVVGAKFEMVQNIPKLSERFRARFRYGAEASYADGEDIDSTLSLTGFTTTGDGLSTPYNNGFSAGGFAALDIGPAFIKASINSDEQVSVNAGLTLRF